MVVAAMSNDSDPYGFDPKKQQKHATRDLFERMEHDVQAQSKGLQQIGAAAGLPKITPIKKRLIDASVKIRQQPPEEIIYQHTVLCQTALPLRQQPNDVRKWQRKQGRAFMQIEAGSALDPKSEEYVDIPLPFGPKARLVLMHLNSEAVRRQSPVIEIEKTMTAFIRRLMNGQDTENGNRCDPNGREIRAFKQQLGSLSVATIRLAIADSARPMQMNSPIIDTFDLWFSKNE